MRRGLPIIAVILAACGAAVTTADNAADASTDVSQGSRRGKQTRPPAEDPAIKQTREMEAAIEGGGMPGCFPPSLRGRQRAVAERLGGVPCDGSSAAAPPNIAGGDPWIGRYSDGEMTISRGSGPNRYAITLKPPMRGAAVRSAATARRPATA